MALAVFVLMPPSYDFSTIQQTRGCFFYRNEDDVRVIAAYLIRQRFGADELVRQRELKVSKGDPDGFWVTGAPWASRIPFATGGGDMEMELRKQGQCLVPGDMALGK